MRSRVESLSRRRSTNHVHLLGVRPERDRCACELVRNDQGWVGLQLNYARFLISRSIRTLGIVPATRLLLISRYFPA